MYHLKDTSTEHHIENAIDQPNIEDQERVYLDYAAATPVEPAVLEVMQPYQSELFGNPSAIHQEGVEARRAVETARQEIARTLQVRQNSVIFTSGGTESNNLAISGVIEAQVAAGRPYETQEIITSKLEHPATLKAVAALEKRGVHVSYVPVNSEGVVDLRALRQLLTTQTVLVTVAHINSEIGVVQPTQAIARTLRDWARSHSCVTPLLHVDGAQSPWWSACDVPRLGADVLSLDMGKCGGPKGVGILAYTKQVTALAPVVHGASQEYGLRPGTEPVPLIVGAAKALSLAQIGVEQRVARITQIRDSVYRYLSERIPEAILNGPLGTQRVANNINISLPGYDTEYAAIVLDRKGFAVSTKSACSSGSEGASHVVFAMSGDLSRANATLRFTFGPYTSETDVLRCVDELAVFVNSMQHYRST